MNIKAFLFDDDRGVSPVIGVILMVAITVILAAVIASFVLGLGDTNESAPNVNFEYDYDEADDELDITMTDGESFDPARVEFQVDGNGDVDDDGTFPVTAEDDPTTGSAPTNKAVVSNTMNDDSTVSAGDSITLNLLNDDDGSLSSPFDTAGFELRIIFTSEDGGTSSEIGGTSGPDA